VQCVDDYAVYVGGENSLHAASVYNPILVKFSG